MRKSYDFSNAIQGAHHKQYAQGHSVRLVKEGASRADSAVGRKKDTQLTELAGRFSLISQLTKDGLEVALPIRDRGVDLIVYADLDEQGTQFVACPIQLKVATGRRFGLDKKYSRIANLLLVYMWDVQEASRSRTYALTYSEALGILASRGHTKTASWEKGKYSISPPGADLVKMLEPFLMEPEGWRARILSAAKTKERKTA
jgi:hypothetical protein